MEISERLLKMREEIKDLAIVEAIENAKERLTTRFNLNLTNINEDFYARFEIDERITLEDLEIMYNIMNAMYKIYVKDYNGTLMIEFIRDNDKINFIRDQILFS